MDHGVPVSSPLSLGMVACSRGRGRRRTCEEGRGGSRQWGDGAALRTRRECALSYHARRRVVVSNFN